MSRFTEEKKRRKDAVRAARRLERQVDTSLEKLERRLLRLIQFKEIITRANVETIVPMWNDFTRDVRELEKGLADMISIISV